MKAKYERQVARAERIEGFGIEHPLTPPNARATALFGQVTVVKLQMRDLGSNQVHGFGLFRGGASERQALARELEQTLRGIWETARALDPVLYPNAAEQFRLPKDPRHQQLVDYGHAFLGAIGPIKTAFVERAWAADFDEQLADKITQLDSAVQRRNTGRQERRSGTAGLDQAVKKLKTIVVELSAIMKAALRTSDPALLAVWKNAARVYSDPVQQPEEETTTPALAAAAVPLSGDEAEVPATIQPRLNGNGAGSVLWLSQSEIAGNLTSGLPKSEFAPFNQRVDRLTGSRSTNIINEDRHLPHDESGLGSLLARFLHFPGEH